MPDRPLHWPQVARMLLAVVVGMCLLSMLGCVDSETRIDQIKADAIASMQLKVDEVAAEKARVASEVHRVQRDAENKLRALGNDADDQAAVIKADAEDSVQDAQVGVERFAAKRAADIEAIHRTTDAAIAKLEAQSDGLQKLAGFVQSPAIAGAISGLPGGSIVSAGIVGLLGYGMRGRAAKQTDAAWDEATKHMLTLMTPPPKAVAA